MLAVAPNASVTPSAGSSSYKEPGESFRVLVPSEQQLACFCVVLGGSSAEALIEGVVASKRERLHSAVKALMALDQRHRLKVFARSMTGTRSASSNEEIPARVAALFTLAHPGRETFIHPEANRLLDEAKNAHPAFRTYAVRARR